MSNYEKYINILIVVLILINVLLIINYCKYKKNREKQTVCDSYIIGEINAFEGNGGTRAINIYKNNILIGMVICSPFYLYGKFKPSSNITVDVKLIEDEAYKKFIKNF